jgi:hypothetical protein
MAITSDRAISLVEAARLIFRTSTPNDKQVHRVYELMKAGALAVRDHAGPPLKWTTSEAALAEFLASRREARANRQQPGQRHADDGEADKLRVVYRNIWRDYFLAVMLRKRMEHRSRAFQHSVVVGQVLLLVALVGLMLGGMRWTFIPLPPERAPIERLIAETTDDYAIERWHPAEPTADGNGSSVRLEYRYLKESKRWVHTDRRFRVVGAQAEELPGE